MRAVVVGASSGLGRCIGVGLAHRGADVALLARRSERLEAAAEEAGNGAVAVRCDVTDEASCKDAIGQSVEALGGIDALIYATGIGPLSHIADLDAETWRRAFDTNVVGASSITAAALPHLMASSGNAAYLTSISSGMTPPWHGLGAYTVTKAALNKLIEAWRAEHPHVGFTQVVVGDCAGGEGDSMTEFANEWDPELATEVGSIWVARNYLTGTLIDVDELVRVVDAVVRCGPSATIPTVAIVPRPLA